MPQVLVVEDNRMLRTLYVAGLSGYGYQVIEAETLEDARALLQSGLAPAAVLLDVQLPDGSGVELLHFIRAVMGRADIPVIIATGLRGDEAELISAGASAVLHKPIEFGALFNKLKTLTTE